MPICFGITSNIEEAKEERILNTWLNIPYLKKKSKAIAEIQTQEPTH